MIGIGIWHHNILIILIGLFFDLCNWFLIPMVNPENELEIVNKVVQIEINWIKKRWGIIKIFTLILAILLLIVLSIGLWENNWVLLTGSFILIAILKHLILLKG